MFGSSITTPCTIGVNLSCSLISPHTVIPSRTLSCLRHTYTKSCNCISPVKRLHTSQQWHENMKVCKIKLSSSSGGVYPSGGTRQIAPSSCTASSMLLGSRGSTERARIVSASSCAMICISPNCSQSMLLLLTYMPRVFAWIIARPSECWMDIIYAYESSCGPLLGFIKLSC